MSADIEAQIRAVADAAFDQRRACWCSLSWVRSR